MKAIISDIHGNLEALQAVLEDVRQYDVEAIYCLGDVVGYGPNPRECLDVVMERCQLVMLGNHDQGAIFDPKGFNGVAERAIFWTRTQLSRRRFRRARRGSALGVPRRVSAHPQGGRLPLPARLAAPSDQRLHLPRGRLPPGQDGAPVPPHRPLLLPRPHARPRHHHRVAAVPRPRRDRLLLEAGRRQDVRQRRLGRPAARRRLARLLRPARQRQHGLLSARGVRRGSDHSEDLRRAGTGRLPRQSAARGR